LMPLGSTRLAGLASRSRKTPYNLEGSKLERSFQLPRLPLLEGYSTSKLFIFNKGI